MIAADIPDGWRMQRLSELISIKHGFAFKGEFFGPVGPFALVTPGNFWDAGGFKHQGQKQKRYAGPVPQDYVLRSGDLIVAMTEQAEGLLGSAALVPEGDAYLHNQRIGLVSSEAMDRQFLYFLFNHRPVRQHIRATSSGAKVRHTSPSRIGEITVAVPPRPVQECIGNVLSAYDDLIGVNRRRIAILEEMARRLFDEWFVRFRFPGWEDISLVDGPLGSVPRGWRTRALEDLCSRITDGAHQSPASTTDGVPMASVKDMQTWDFDLSKCRKISVADYRELARNDCKPLKGDVLIAKDGSYLKHVFLVREDRHVAILSSIAILRPNGELRPELFVQMLRDKNTSARMKGFVSGVAIPRIVLKDFRKFLITCPPAHLQELWCKIAGPMLEQCWSLDRQNTCLRAARDLLLPKLISGEIEVGAAERALEDAA